MSVRFLIGDARERLKELPSERRVVTVYYNEIDPYCCAWLSNLMDAGQITPGTIDDRPIQELHADDVRGYDRAHFFAGAGGWDLALDLAGWGSRSVWTGSCPCQPFSAAGAGKAADDERHLWPAWASLIAECRPGTVFGEQVEAAIGWGWLDAVFADLEAEGYACGATVLPACSVGAPHIRQRLWFVADAGRQPCRVGDRSGGTKGGGAPLGDEQFRDGGAPRGVADDDGRGRAVVAAARLHAQGEPGHDTDGRGNAGDLADAPRGLAITERGGRQRAERPELQGLPGGQHQPPRGSGERSALADTERDGGRADEPQRQAEGRVADERASGVLGYANGSGLQGWREHAGEHAGQRASRKAGASFWSDAILILCADGKARPVEPGSFPLAHGVLARPSKLRAYGNAIVVSLAAEFVSAFMGTRQE